MIHRHSLNRATRHDVANSIGIAGTGRVAQALGRLLSEKGQPVVAIAGRNPERTMLAAEFIGPRTAPVTIEELPIRASRILIAVSLAPLVRASAENALGLGPVEALTGPIQRGDSATVLTHLKALRNVPDLVRRLYCSAGEVVVQMASSRGLQATKASEIQEILRRL